MTQNTLVPATTHRFPQAQTRQTAARTRGADRFWPVLRDLIEARNVFGLRRPVLATLRALISFVEEGSVVFASNRSITTRAEGISESALRRHIKALIDLGLVTRRDSSNGKRYRLDAQGQQDLVFGLDLAPLEAAGARIAEAAERCRSETRMIRYLRKRLGQLIYLARSFGRSEDEIKPYQNALRQKLSVTAYEELCGTIEPGLKPLCETPVSTPEIGFASKMTGRDIQNDCHKNITEERILITVEEQTAAEELDGSAPDRGERTPERAQPPSRQAPPSSTEAPVEQQLLRKAKALAPEALAFAEAPLESWNEVETLAWRLASWSGISPSLLNHAIETAGQRMTAMAVLLVTQNAGRIRNPGAYFRTLTLGRHHDRFARPLAHLN